MPNTKFPAKQKILATVGAGVVAMIVLFFFMLKPLASDLGELHLTAQDQHTKLERLLLEEQGYKTARTDLAKIQSRANEIQSLFPPREELVGFVRDLEDIAQIFDSDFTIAITDLQDQAETSGGKATQLDYAVVPGLTGLEVIPYDIRLEGSFSNIVRFLQAFENQSFFSEIESLNISSKLVNTGGGSSSGSNTVRSGNVQATVRAAFYASQ